MGKKPPFIMVDGSSYLFRAYYALPTLTNTKGEQTGAIYGVINMLRRLINDYQPEYMAVVFDPKGKTFRHKLYPDYKANRPEMAEELSSQIKPLFEIIKALGLPLVIEEGVEADDVIGTLSRHAHAKKWETLISTSDKDLAQIVTNHVTLINTMTGKTLTPEGVVEKFGVKPEQIIDYLTLIGDKVDNVPGVDKVGPKTAAKWLAQYHNLDKLVKHADEIGGKVGENFRAVLEQLPIAKQLVTIHDDLKLQVGLEDLKRQAPNQEKLIELFRHLEFNSWLSELLTKTSTQSISNKTKSTDYQLVLTKQQLNGWVSKLKKAKTFALDTETTNIKSMLADLVGISVAVEQGEAAYIPVNHQYEDAPIQLEKDLVLETLKPLLTDKQYTIVGQNIKYDYKILKHSGISLSANLVDTLLESYVLNSASTRHDLDTLALNYLEHQMISFEDVAGSGRKQVTFDQVSLDKATAYAAEDSDITLQLHHKLWPQIAKQGDLQKVLLEIEMPLMPILAEMEYYGVLVDVKKLKQHSHALNKKLDKLSAEIFNLAGTEFNIDSPKQLGEVLFEKLKLPVSKKTPTGQPATSESVLQALAHDYPLPKLILEYRSLNKLKSTYTDKLPEEVNSKTGRVHTSYKQTVTSTGRLSSKDPNLQNIPIRTDEGRKIRQAFIAPEGYKIVSADYSQVELRIMAHLSEDPNLIKAFEQDIDIHQATASEVFGVTLEKVTPLQRRNAKAINFGLLYGMSAFGLAKQLGIERVDAEEYIATYFKRYPGVKKYMQAIRAVAHKKGHVETLRGRRLLIPDIKSSNVMRRNAAERAAINAPLQGSAADIIKLAMIDCHEWINHSKDQVHMIMQVHDELVFEVESSAVNTVMQKIKHSMENAAQLIVPLKVSLGVGDNWDEAH